MGLDLLRRHLKYRSFLYQLVVFCLRLSIVFFPIQAGITGKIAGMKVLFWAKNP